MILIKRINGKGECQTKEIRELNWFKCQSVECDVAIHFEVVTQSLQLIEVSREEFIRLSREVEVHWLDLPEERSKSKFSTTERTQ
jgi:hypothetical protein